MSGEAIVVRVRLFATLRERAGTSAFDLDLPAEATVADALAALTADGPLAGVLDRLPVRAAVNRGYTEDSTVLREGDELALIPPVSGGEGSAGPRAVHVAVSEQPLSADRLRALVAHPGAGAIVTFEGVTRDVPRLEYEAYAEMAAERMEEILRSCVREHALLGAAAEHRVGDVRLGEPSVVVAVSAAHRGEAFAGARAAIDEIKASAPVWKREHPAEGEPRWVSGKVPR